MKKKYFLRDPFRPWGYAFDQKLQRKFYKWYRSNRLIEALRFHHSDERKKRHGNITPISDVFVDGLIVHDFIPSSLFKELTRKLQAEKWAGSHSHSPEKVEAFLKKLRLHGHGGGSISLPTYRNYGDKRPFGNHLESKLPHWCKYVEVRLNQLSSSLICASFVFGLKKHYANDYVTGYNRPFKPKLEPVPTGGWMIYSEEDLKKQAISRIRHSRVMDIECWISNNFPTASSTSDAFSPQVYEVVEFSQFDPSTETSRKENQKLSDAIGLRGSYLSWVYDVPKGLVYYENISDKLDNYGVLAINIKNANREFSMGKQRISSSHFIQQYTGNALMWRSLDGLLVSYRRDIVDLRDSVAGLTKLSSTIASISTFTKASISQFDIGLVVSDFQEKLDSDNLRVDGDMKLVRFDKFDENAEGFKKNILWRMNRRINEVRELNDLLNEHLETRSGLASSFAILCLTVAVLVLSLLALGVSIISVFKS